MEGNLFHIWNKGNTPSDMTVISQRPLAHTLYVHSNKFCSPEACTFGTWRGEKHIHLQLFPGILLSLYLLFALPPALVQLRWPGFMLAASQQL